MAWTMVFLEAAHAGRKPPKAPMIAAKASPANMAKGLTLKSEGDIGEGGEVSDAGGQAVDGEGQEDAEDAAEECEEDGFEHEGEEDGGVAEADGAEGADFLGASGDGGVHGVGGGEGAADGHDDGDGEAEEFEGFLEAGHVGVVLFFLEDVDAEARSSSTDFLKAGISAGEFKRTSRGSPPGAFEIAGQLWSRSHQISLLAAWSAAWKMPTTCQGLFRRNGHA